MASNNYLPNKNDAPPIMAAKRSEKLTKIPRSAATAMYRQNEHWACIAVAKDPVAFFSNCLSAVAARHNRIDGIKQKKMLEKLTSNNPTSTGTVPETIGLAKRKASSWKTRIKETKPVATNPRTAKINCHFAVETMAVKSSRSEYNSVALSSVGWYGLLRSSCSLKSFWDTGALRSELRRIEHSDEHSTHRLPKRQYTVTCPSRFFPGQA